MSSQAVRDVIFNSVEALAAPIQTFDLSQYHDIEDVLGQVDGQACLVQFVIADEEIQNIGGEGNQGWREDGTVTVHLIQPTGFDSDALITKGDTIRLGLRGQRVAPSVVIESMSPFVDFGAGAISREGAWHGFAATLFYVRRDCG